MTAKKPKTYFKTKSGKMLLGDSLEVLRSMKDGSVDLIMTSPPFGLVRKKEYGNVDADGYVDWFRSFAAEFYRVLGDQGSAVVDIGGAWNQGIPTRHLYHFKLLIMMCEEFGFHLAQDFYWWNPSKLPSPAEWGDGTAGAREGRHQYDLVAVENALAQGEQPPRVATLQRKHAGSAGTGVQSKKASVRARH